MVRLLTQPQYNPMTTAQQVISIFAGTRGYMDSLPPNDIPDFEKGLLQFAQESNRDFYDDLSKDLKLTKELAERLGKIIDEYKKTYKKK
jgi:F-type H+-transporting ATPase subunit alpha